MASPFTAGVIGVGHLGAHHARVLAQSASWHLVGVYDIDSQKNAAVTAQYNLAPCASADELIARSQAVVICTPTASHAQLALQAIAQGKHVFIEKPLCATRAEATALVDAARRQGLVGAVGHIERFNPAVAAARPHIVAPRFIEAHRLNQFSPRGLATDIVLEVMIHDIDLVRELVGSDPSEIRAAGVAVLSDTDDIANCRLMFPNGCVANLTASRISASPMRKMRIFSVDQYTSIDFAARSAESYRLVRGSPDPGLADWRPLAAWQERAIMHRSFPAGGSDALEAELADFHAAITGGRRPRVDIDEGAASLKVALAVADACRAHTSATAVSSPPPV